MLLVWMRTWMQMHKSDSVALECQCEIIIRTVCLCVAEEWAPSWHWVNVQNNSFLLFVCNSKQPFIGSVNTFGIALGIISWWLASTSSLSFIYNNITQNTQSTTAIWHDLCVMRFCLWIFYTISFLVWVSRMCGGLRAVLLMRPFSRTKIAL